MRNLSAVVLVLSALSGMATAASASVEERVLGPANKGGAYMISPRGGHVAYAGSKGTRVQVIVDGVEGPEFDELYTPYGQSFFSAPTVTASTASPGGRSNAAAQMAPVIMSPDGSHWAYAGRQGEEYVVIHDGKEVGRGSRPTLGLHYGPLTLSPAGRHVYWNEITAPGGARSLYRLMMDGQPGTWSGHQDLLPVFSPDDSRFAYSLVSPEDQNKRSLIIDGNPAGYEANTPIFTADSKHLITQSTGTQGGQAGSGCLRALHRRQGDAWHRECRGSLVQPGR